MTMLATQSTAFYMGTEELARAGLFYASQLSWLSLLNSTLLAHCSLSEGLSALIVALFAVRGFLWTHFASRIRSCARSGWS